MVDVLGTQSSKYLLHFCTSCKEETMIPVGSEDSFLDCQVQRRMPHEENASEAKARHVVSLLMIKCACLSLDISLL